MASYGQTTWTSEQVCGSQFAVACASFGSCAPNGACVCQPGFRASNLFVRVDDCATPVVLLPVAFAIAIVTGVFVVAYAAVVMNGVRGPMRNLVACLGLASVFFTLACTVGLIQDNTGRAFFVLLAGFHILTQASFAWLLQMFLRTTRMAMGSQASKAQIIRANRLVMACAFFQCLPVGVFVPILALALGDETAADYPIELWNNCVMWAHGVLPFIYIVTTIPIALFLSSELLKQLSESMRMSHTTSNSVAKAKLNDVKKRIGNFRLAVLGSPLMLFPSLTLLLGVAYSFRWPIIGYAVFLNAISANAILGWLLFVLKPESGKHVENSTSSGGAAAAAPARVASQPRTVMVAEGV